MAKREPGRFIREPGTARKYLDTETGRSVSRRQRDKIMEAAGKRTRLPEARVAKHRIQMRAYKGMVDDYAKAHGIKKKTDARESAEFRETLKKLYSPSQADKIAALKTMGRRNGIPDYVKPGESPQYKKAKEKDGVRNRTQWREWRRKHGLGK